MYKQQNIGVVVPAYCEEELIGETLSSMPEYVDRIYAVDDASLDRTYGIMREIADEDSRIVCIKHDKNRGVGAAIVSGFKRAIEDGMGIAVVMAGDNQMDPAYLPDLLDPIVDGKADFTKGNRLRRGYWKGMSKWRLFGNFLLTFLTKIASGYWHISDSQNGYVAISTRPLRELLNPHGLYEGFAFENDMMIKANIINIRMMNVLIPARYTNEKSKIRHGRFIINTSIFLLTSFFRRLSKKHLEKRHID